MKVFACSAVRLPTWNAITNRDARSSAVQVYASPTSSGSSGVTRLLLADVGPRFVALDVRADEVARDLVVQTSGARSELDGEPRHGASVDVREVGCAAFAVRVHERVKHSDAVLSGENVGQGSPLAFSEGARPRLRCEAPSGPTARCFQPRPGYQPRRGFCLGCKRECNTDSLVLPRKPRTG